VKTRTGSGVSVVIDGRLTYANRNATLPVGLFSYVLKRTITYADGTPVKDAIVTTRTNDRKFWMFSTRAPPTGSIRPSSSRPTRKVTTRFR
jgi:hypothetical protein